MERLELDVLMIRANLHLANGRYVEARRILDEVLTEDPGHGIAHGLMGWLCWILLDDADRASIHYRASIHFAPEHAAHYEQPNLSLIADKAALHGELATALERAGRTGEALIAFRAAAAAATDLTAERKYTAQAVRVRRKLGSTIRWIAW